MSSFSCYSIFVWFANERKDRNFRGLNGTILPSRTKDIDDVDISTGSVGLGVTTGFIINTGLHQTKSFNHYSVQNDCFGWDAEPDEEYLRMPSRSWKHNQEMFQDN